MTQPTQREVDVAVETLRTEAGIWDQQSHQLQAIVSGVGELRLSRIEAGVFQLIVSPYDAVVDQITACCAEGVQQMTRIASTLRTAADVYEEEDRNNEHSIRNLY